MSVNKVLVVLNGILKTNLNFGSYDKIICADGAYDKVKDKCNVDVIVGDMDSIVQVPNIDNVKHNVDKDYTDGQLAVEYANNFNPKQIDIIGVNGGRVDHVLYNFSLCRYGKHITLLGDNFECRLLDSGNHNINTIKGDTISLVPFFGLVHINSTIGLKYPIIDRDIDLSTIATISNVAIDNNIKINIGSGQILLFDKLKE